MKIWSSSFAFDRNIFPVLTVVEHPSPPTSSPALSQFIFSRAGSTKGQALLTALHLLSCSFREHRKNIFLVSYLSFTFVGMFKLPINILKQPQSLVNMLEVKVFTSSPWTLTVRDRFTPISKAGEQHQLLWRNWSRLAMSLFSSPPSTISLRPGFSNTFFYVPMATFSCWESEKARCAKQHIHNCLSGKCLLCKSFGINQQLLSPSFLLSKKKKKTNKKTQH